VPSTLPAAPGAVGQDATEQNIDVAIDAAAEASSTASSQDDNDGVRLEDFIAFLPQHGFYHRPTGAMWSAISINAKIPPIEVDGKKISPTSWLDAYRCAQQMTWMPGEPPQIKDKLISEGGWIPHPGATGLNTYRGPTVVPGNADEATRWVDHVRKVYPDDADHLLAWFAHRVQHPGTKINHCLFLGGSPGIGKDSLLAPVINAVGPWNCHEIAPKALLDRFNGYIKGLIVRVSEARDLGEVSRYEFYEACKTLCAAPPEVLRCNEKHTKEFYIPNVCGLIITSNYRTDGIYLPPDDRRHFVTWSGCSAGDFAAHYWNELWAWYHNGGLEHVAAHLRSYDLSHFNPTAPPPKTDAFWAIVDAGAAPEDSEFADALDQLGKPKATTIEHIKVKATGYGGLREWLEDRKNRRSIPHRFEKAGYTAFRNSAAKSDGLFKIHGRRQAIYVKDSLSEKERHEAAEELVNRSNQAPVF
jgi:hypothetical protein